MLVLGGKTPSVTAAADGTEGMFVVDTGSTGALTLRRKFVEDHGLEARHPSALRITSIGAAGRYESLDSLETGTTLPCPCAEGTGTLEPDFIAPVVESGHELSQDLVSKAAVDIGEREPLVAD